ncbi:hypothetical protein BaRGS_00030582, partial [Batillaria attramentaria]
MSKAGKKSGKLLTNFVAGDGGGILIAFYARVGVRVQAEREREIAGWLNGKPR